MPLPPTRRGLYAPVWTKRTYTELLARAERLLSLGESVVVDASWIDHHWREAAAALGGEVHADLVAVRCAAPREIAAGRLRSRIGISDADETIAAAMQAGAEPWPEAHTADTTTSLEETVRHVVEHARPHPAVRPWLPRRPMLEPD